MKNNSIKIKQKLDNIINKLSKDLIEREDTLKLSILCAFAGESIFLLGLPGIAKSLISRKVASIFKDAKNFEILMSKYTAPDEIFGPIDISGLKEGSYKRKINNYLPSANIAFLDEIWKASSSIQNTLLTILNEKIFLNDGIPTPVNLELIIAASNELPERNQGLEALWDRFVIRINVEPIKSNDKFLEMITNQRNLADVKHVTDDEKIALNELDEIRKAARNVEFSKDVLDFILEFRNLIKSYNDEILAKDQYAELLDLVYISDRKWKKIAGILQVSALLNDRQVIDLTDCYLIEHMSWNTAEQQSDIHQMILKAIFRIEFRKILKDFEDKYLLLKQELFELLTNNESKTIVVIKEYNNTAGSYYWFVDDKGTNYFFEKSGIDSIPMQTKEMQEVDWLLDYVTEEEFNKNIVGEHKGLIKFENNEFYLYEDNDESKPKHLLKTEYVEKLEETFVTKTADEQKLYDWKVQVKKAQIILAHSRAKIHEEIQKIMTNDSNIFWSKMTVFERAEQLKYLAELLFKLENAYTDLETIADSTIEGYKLKSISSLIENFDLKPLLEQ